jgi:hypothetical protein
MKLHYLYSNKRAVKSAIIHFNGEKQNDAQFVDDETGTITRRKYGPGGLVNGTETLTGKVTIELPAGVQGGPYKTKDA